MQITVLRRIFPWDKKQNKGEGNTSASAPSTPDLISAAFSVRVADRIKPLEIFSCARALGDRRAGAEVGDL